MRLSITAIVTGRVSWSIARAGVEKIPLVMTVVSLRSIDQRVRGSRKACSHYLEEEILFFISRWNLNNPNVDWTEHYYVSMLAHVVTCRGSTNYAFEWRRTLYVHTYRRIER